MKTSQLDEQEEKYNSEYLLVDSFWEFHRDAFDLLDQDELRDLLTYYPQTTEVADVFAYRADLIRQLPGVDVRGRQALSRVLSSLGVTLEE